MSTGASWSVYGSLVLVQVLFGLQYLAAKVAFREIEPRALAVFRIVLGALVLVAIVRASGRPWPRPASLVGRLAFLSLFGVIANQLLFLEGLARTTPTHSSLINSTIPVTTLVFAVLAGRERATATRIVACVIATAGVVLVIRPWAAAATGQHGTLLGDLLTLANATSYALFLTLSKPLMKRVDSLAATAVLLCFGTIGIGLFGAPQVAALDLAAVSTTTWLLVLYVGVFATAGAYALQYRALTHVDSSVVALFIYLQPVVASTLAVLVLGDRPAPIVLCGGALIFLGVALALRRRRR